MKPKRPDVGEIGWHDAYWAYRYYAEDMDKWLRDEVVPVLRNLLKVAEDQHSRIGDIRKCDECHYAAEDADALLKGLADPEQQCDANGGGR